MFAINFNYSDLNKLCGDSEILKLITEIHEYKGRLELILNDKKRERLSRTARLQSVYASCRLSGNEMPAERIRQLCGISSPKDVIAETKEEREALGYNSALELVFSGYENAEINTATICLLHKYAMGHSEGSGKFLKIQHYKYSVLENGKYAFYDSAARFSTAGAVKEICASFEKCSAENRTDALILIPAFIRDFLNIHPFEEGSGRAGRLLLQLLLLKFGYMQVRYISIEEKILKSKDNYWAALSESAYAYEREKNTAFIKYFLTIFRDCCRELDETVLSDRESRPAERIEKATRGRTLKFTKKDVLEMCPDIGVKTAENALRLLCDKGVIKKRGSGRTTFYMRVD